MYAKDKGMAIEIAKRIVTRNGGKVVDAKNKDGSRTKTVAVRKPGIKVWGAVDMLVNHAGFILLGE